MGKNTSLPEVPGMAARNVGSSMEAIQKALMLYLQLKQQEKENQVQQQTLDLRAADQERQGRSTDALADYYKSQSSNLTADNDRMKQDQAFKQFNTNADNYAGQRVPKDSPIVGQARAAGVDPNIAFTPEMTLPATQSIGAAAGLPQGGGGMAQPAQRPQMPAPVPGSDPSYFKPVPQTETGNLTINEPNPAKVRMAEANRAAVDARAAAAEQGRNDRARLTNEVKRQTLTQQAWFRNIAQQMQQKGLDLQLQRFMQQAIAQDNSMDIKEWEMKLKQLDAGTKGGTYLDGILQSLEAPRAPGVPGAAPNGKQYPDPPQLRRPGVPAGPSTAPAGPASSRFRIVQEP